jgi:hypothetical protein
MFPILFLTILSLCNSQIAFLGESSLPVKVDYSSWIEDTEAVVLGLFDGIKIFKGLPHQTNCTNNFPLLVNRVVRIVQLFENLPVDDYVPFVENVFEELSGLLQEVGQAFTPCDGYVKDVIVDVEQLIQYFEDPAYLDNLKKHSLYNIGGFIDRVTKASVAFKNNDLLTGSTAIGDLINFAFFWDFQYHP